MMLLTATVGLLKRHGAVPSAPAGIRVNNVLALKIRNACLISEKLLRRNPSCVSQWHTNAWR